MATQFPDVGPFTLRLITRRKNGYPAGDPFHPGLNLAESVSGHHVDLQPVRQCVQVGFHTRNHQPVHGQGAIVIQNQVFEGEGAVTGDLEIYHGASLKTISATVNGNGYFA